MNTDTLVWLERISGLRVLVIGEAMLDSYLAGTSDRRCPEAPVPVITVSHRQDSPGGAANTAANVAALGGCVIFLSTTGSDPEGARLQQALVAHGVSTAHLLAASSRQTLTKQRLMVAAQMLVRVDQGSTHAVEPDVEQALIQRLTQAFPHCDAVIVSDYSYGILTPRVVQAIAQAQAQTPRVLAVDARRLDTYRDVGVTVAKPNYAEAVQLLGIDPVTSGDRSAQVAAYQSRLLDLTGVRIVAVTLDVDGSVILARGCSPYRVAAPTHPQVYPAGAGDTFLSAFTLALAAGATASTAAELAAAAAAVVVSQPGTATCSLQALHQHFDGPTVQAERTA